MTDNVMAKTVDNAENLLMQIWRPAVKRVHEEVAEMQSLADRENAGITIEPWDYYYYAEKCAATNTLSMKTKYAHISHSTTYATVSSRWPRPCTALTSPKCPTPRNITPEVTVYDVTDNDGAHVAVFMTDYFPRASKRQGAWMEEPKAHTSVRTAHRQGLSYTT